VLIDTWQRFSQAANPHSLGQRLCTHSPLVCSTRPPMGPGGMFAALLTTTITGIQYGRDYLHRTRWPHGGMSRASEDRLLCTAGTRYTTSFTLVLSWEHGTHAHVFLAASQLHHRPCDCPEHAARTKNARAVFVLHPSPLYLGSPSYAED